MSDTVILKEVSITSSNDRDNYANVAQAVVERDSADGTKAVWTVMLNGVPRIKNFLLQENLVLNTKGTYYYLKVTSVMGPGKYKCSGNWPINI